MGGQGQIDAVGTDARFRNLAPAIAADRSGNVYVNDGQLLRRIGRDGRVSAFAGIPGSFAHTDGSGTQASFGEMGGMTTDAAGNIYVLEGNRAFPPSGSIRKITPDGVVTTMPNSDQVVFHKVFPGRYTTFGVPSQIAVDNTGAVYTIGNGDAGNNAVWKLTPAGEVTQLPETAGPLATDAIGNLYIASTTAPTIRKRAPDGTTTTLVSLPADPLKGAAITSMTVGGNRVLYVDAGAAVAAVNLDPVPFLALNGFTIGDPQQAGTVDGEMTGARLTGSPIAADGEGNVFQVGNLTVRKITPTGSVFTFAGGGPLVRGFADGVGAAARFRFPLALAPDSSGNVYVADYGGGVIRKIDRFARVSTVAGRDAVIGDADGVGTQATFQEPLDIALGASGTLYVLQGNHRLRKIAPDGTVTTTILPTSIGASCGRAIVLDSQENLYVSCIVLIRMTPAGVISAPWNPGFDAGPSGPLFQPATSPRYDLNAIYHQQERLAIDREGNLYGISGADQILKFRTDGLVQPLPGSAPAADVRRQGIAVDAQGNVYVSESASFPLRDPGEGITPGFIRKLTPAGAVTTVAGNAALTGTLLGDLPGALDSPRGIAFIGTNTLAVAMPAAVVKIVMP